MAVGSSQTTVGTDAVLLAQAPGSGGPGPVGSVLISNGAGDDIYLGGSGVTTSNGSLLAASTAVTLWLFPGDAIYAVAATDSSDVGTLQT